MPTQTTDGQRVASDTTTQRGQDLMIQLVRHGQDISLRSLQVWADLSRQLGSTTLGSPGRAVMISLAYDVFEKVLTAQRQVVDELVATQRQRPDCPAEPAECGSGHLEGDGETGGDLVGASLDGWPGEA
ncbi:MAG: hypothetical protein ACRDS0_32055 [Pseudonocardiaceae bacterium]